MPSPRTIARALVIAVNLLVGVAMIEAILAVLLHEPRLTAEAPGAVRRLAQQVYRHFNRMLVQFDEHCAQYDREVTYTLRPGTCTFANIEFNTTLRINRLGLRDDDAALDGPEVIVIGDSHAMGWGVEHDEAFPAVLARASGRKVLNAAVSSYATVRERKMLDRLDTSKLRVLVVQYSDNDLIENRAYSEGGNHLTITEQATYENIVRYYAKQQTYYPGKYVFRLTLKLTHLEAPEPDQLAMEPVSPDREVALFLNALTTGGTRPLPSVPVVVLEVNQDLRHAHAFTTALSNDSPSAGGGTVRIVPFDSSTVLRPEDFFVLDDHMTAAGHRRIGEALAGVIRDF